MFQLTTNNPELSIIIASINGKPYLAECLTALHGQAGNVTAEVIVADCVGPSVTNFVSAKYPEVELITFDEPRRISELRAVGIRAARGKIVAITEDHCIPAPDWYEAIRRAHINYPEPAIGGAVDNAAVSRTVDWAVYFCEYSNFISPVPSGMVHDLPGPNVSYKRSVLMTMADIIQQGYWETFLHAQMETRGVQLRSDPSIKVLHKKHFHFMGFLIERFHYARAFAGMRNESISLARRIFYLIFSPLLLLLLLIRISHRVLSRKRHLTEFARSLPYILIFMIAWAVGEGVGYLTGPGNSSWRIS